MLTIIKLPSHDFIAHVLNCRGAEDSFARDEKHIYVSIPDTIDEIDNDKDAEIWNGLMDLAAVGLVRCVDNHISTEPQATTILEAILPAIAKLPLF